MSTNSNATNEYFDSVSEFHKCKSIKSENVNIMHINAQSCAKIETFDEIKSFVDNCKFEIDIIIIGETWFKQNHLCLYELSGYTSIHSCREHKRGGGLSMYVREPCNITKTEIQKKLWNSVNVEIRNYRGINNLNICGVYRPPNKSNMTSYLHEIERILSQLCGEILLIGDINVDLNKSNDREVKMYNNTMTSIGLSRCNSNITRESSNATLDHVYTNIRSQHKIYTATIKCHFSDHNILITSFHAKEPTSCESRLVKKLDMDLLISNVGEKMNHIPLASDPNTHYNALNDQLQSGIQHATTTKSKKKINRKYCEWLHQNPNTIRLIKQKNNLYRKHKEKIKNKTCGESVILRLRELEIKLKNIKSTAKHT